MIINNEENIISLEQKAKSEKLANILKSFNGDLSNPKIYATLANFFEIEEPTAGAWVALDVRIRYNEMKEGGIEFDSELTADDERKVLEIVQENFDATVGINWEHIEEAIKEYFGVEE